MGFYEIASLVLQAATLFAGILALRASRKNDRQVSPLAVSVRKNVNP